MSHVAAKTGARPSGLHAALIALAVVALMGLGALPPAVQAQEPVTTSEPPPAPPSGQRRTALAQLLLDQSSLSRPTTRAQAGELHLRLALSQPVPFRSFLLDDPRRLVVDFRELDFRGHAPADLPGAETVRALRWGKFRDGWSRLVIELDQPYAIASARLETRSEPARIELVLRPVSVEDFAPRPFALSALWDLPDPTVQTEPDLPAPLAAPDSPVAPATLRVMIDPGHGGHDSGATVGSLREADLMLSFARELSEALIRRGVDARMTRESDVFIDLESRMTRARTAQADLFVSLHADALPAGQAAGATVYIWNPDSNDRAARELAARHDRDDLLGGLDLGQTDDQIAGLLMDMARTDTQPRSENVAKFLSSNMARSGVDLLNNPVRGAAFAVLKSPDIPSVLIELGFLTDARDRANLLDPDWRAHMIEAISRAILDWHADEQVREGLLRR